MQKSHFDLSHCESPWWPFCHRYLPFVVTAHTHEPTELIDPSGVTAFCHCFKILLLNRIICAQRINPRKCFCSLYPCPVLCNHTIDERLTKKGKKKHPPTAVQCHCLTGLLEVLGSPMFTKLNLSACHWLPDGRRCYVTDIRKMSFFFFRGDEKLGGGFKEWEEYEERRRWCIPWMGITDETDVLDPWCSSHTSSMSI